MFAANLVKLKIMLFKEKESIEILNVLWLIDSADKLNFKVLVLNKTERKAVWIRITNL